MPFTIIREDITRVRADAIVNTANPEPMPGRGTDHGIYQAAGYEELLEARRKIGRLSVGEAAATEAFALPAKYIIHTVGPKWRGGSENEYRDLAACYRKSLLLARQLGCESIAFPLIAAGSYHFPKDRALHIALSEIRSFLDHDDMDVTLVVFGREAFALSEELVGPVRAYIDEKYAAKKREQEYAGFAEKEQQDSWMSSVSLSGSMPLEDASADSGPLLNAAPMYSMPEALSGTAEPAETQSAPTAKKKKARLGKRRFLKDLHRQVGESYQQCLLRLIDERGCTDVEVYKKANLDRRLFSKIRSNPDYHPKKTTALALAMALELNMDETRDLLGRAGIALSDASLFDIIIEYCIDNHIYDLFTVNALLFEHDQPLLGS